MFEHLQNGALKDHTRNIHRNILTRPEIEKNIYYIQKFDDVKKQKLYEALMIYISLLPEKYDIY